MTNNAIRNRVIGHEHGMWTRNTGNGKGKAKDKICTQAGFQVDPTKSAWIIERASYLFFGINLKTDFSMHPFWKSKEMFFMTANDLECIPIINTHVISFEMKMATSGTVFIGFLID